MFNYGVLYGAVPVPRERQFYDKATATVRDLFFDRYCISLHSPLCVSAGEGEEDVFHSAVSFP